MYLIMEVSMVVSDMLMPRLEASMTKGLSCLVFSTAMEATWLSTSTVSKLAELSLAHSLPPLSFLFHLWSEQNRVFTSLTHLLTVARASNFEVCLEMFTVFRVLAKVLRSFEGNKSHKIQVYSDLGSKSSLGKLLLILIICAHRISFFPKI